MYLKWENNTILEIYKTNWIYQKYIDTWQSQKKKTLAQSAAAVEHTECIAAEG